MFLFNSFWHSCRSKDFRWFLLLVTSRTLEKILSYQYKYMHLWMIPMNHVLLLFPSCFAHNNTSPWNKKHPPQVGTLTQFLQGSNPFNTRSEISPTLEPLSEPARLPTSSLTSLAHNEASLHTQLIKYFMDFSTHPPKLQHSVPHHYFTCVLRIFEWIGGPRCQQKSIHAFVNLSLPFWIISYACVALFYANFPPYSLAPHEKWNLSSAIIKELQSRWSDPTPSVWIRESTETLCKVR